MIVSWISFACFFTAALIHIYFFIFEFFLFPKKESGPAVVWAKNVAIYNLSLAFGVLYGLRLIFQKQIMMAGLIVSFCGLTMLVAGITLWITAPSFRKWALLQAVPPGIGFIFLVFHILDRLGFAAA